MRDDRSSLKSFPANGARDSSKTLYAVENWLLAILSTSPLSDLRFVMVEQIVNTNCLHWLEFYLDRGLAQVRVLMVHRSFASDNDFPLLPNQGEARIGSLGKQIGKWMIGNAQFKLLLLCFLVRLSCQTNLSYESLPPALFSTTKESLP